MHMYMYMYLHVFWTICYMLLSIYIIEETPLDSYGMVSIHVYIQYMTKITYV